MSKVLVVEDDKNTLAGLIEILNGEGFEVAGAADASSALSLGGSGIDVLLTDLRLPDMTGLELIAEIQKKNADIVPIVMTAYGTPEFCLQGEKLAVHAWLTKPLNIDKLVHLLGEASAVKALEKEAL